MLELEPTEDILAEASAIAHARADAAGDPGARPVLVGFAAETGSLERAPEKAARKRVDLLVANDVAEPGSGLRHRHQPGDHRHARAPLPSRGPG